MSDFRRTQITSAALGPSSVLTRVDTSAVRLVVANTVSKGATFVLKGGNSIIVGASETAALRIDDPTVSGEHVRITQVDGGTSVEDLGSTNGTFYQRSRVQEVVVPIGATIMVGKAQLKISPEEQEIQAAPSAVAHFGALVGDDRRMRQMFSLLSDVAPTDATVVIEGETGTGKELVATALHDNSLRAAKSFVVFDCSSVPHDLVESSLFGHLKGSFTGATQNRQGAFRRAHGGTIFLDEIGELPLDLQPKLLRAIESRTVQMVGSDSYERVDVRVLAATNRNLKDEVRAGRFREDLYYRLAVVRIVLPSLRGRIDDLRILVEHFLKRQGATLRLIPDIDPNCYGKLKRYPFPGNVRELKNLVDRAVSLFRGEGLLDLTDYLRGVGDTLHDEDDSSAPPTLLPISGAVGFEEIIAAVSAALETSARLPFKQAKNVVVEAFERRYLSDLLRDHDGNISRAAQAAQMDRKHLRELLKKNGLWQG